MMMTLPWFEIFSLGSRPWLDAPRRDGLLASLASRHRMACATTDSAVGAVDAELDHGVFPDNSSPSEDGDSFCGVEVAADMSSLGSYMEVVPSSTGSACGAATPECAFRRLELSPMTAAEELGLPSSGTAKGGHGQHFAVPRRRKFDFRVP